MVYGALTASGLAVIAAGTLALFQAGSSIWLLVIGLLGIHVLG